MTPAPNAQGNATASMALGLVVGKPMPQSGTGGANNASPPVGTGGPPANAPQPSQPTTGPPAKLDPLQARIAQLSADGNRGFSGRGLDLVGQATKACANLYEYVSHQHTGVRKMFDKRLCPIEFKSRGQILVKKLAAQWDQPVGSAVKTTVKDTILASWPAQAYALSRAVGSAFKLFGSNRELPLNCSSSVLAIAYALAFVRSKTELVGFLLLGLKTFAQMRYGALGTYRKALMVYTCLAMVVMFWNNMKVVFSKSVLAYFGASKFLECKYHGVFVSDQAPAGSTLPSDHPSGIDVRPAILNNTRLSTKASFREAHYYNSDAVASLDAGGVAFKVDVPGPGPRFDGRGSVRTGCVELERVANSLHLPTAGSDEACDRALAATNHDIALDRTVNVTADAKVKTHADNVALAEIMIRDAASSGMLGNLNEIAPRSTLCMERSWGNWLMLKLLSRL